MWQNDIFFATFAVDALIVVANWEKFLNMPTQILVVLGI